jgi:hypothetical protein
MVQHKAVVHVGVFLFCFDDTLQYKLNTVAGPASEKKQWTVPITGPHVHICLSTDDGVTLEQSYRVAGAK